MSRALSLRSKTSRGEDYYNIPTTLVRAYELSAILNLDMVFIVLLWR